MAEGVVDGVETALHPSELGVRKNSEATFGEGCGRIKDSGVVKKRSEVVEKSIRQRRKETGRRGS